MGDFDQGKFSQLTPEEVSNKLAAVASKNEVINLWEKGADAFSSRLKESTFDGHLTLTFFNDSAQSFFEEAPYFLNFNDGKLEYYLEGKVGISKDEEFTIIITENIFRREHRIEERLLTYPHRQSYIYFKHSDHTVEGGENVIFLNSDGSKKSFKNKEGMRALPESLSEYEDELVGFRVLDVSSEGVSALASSEEVLFFNHQDSLYTFKLLLEGEVFTIIDADLVYKVDYMNPRLKSSSHYKIGFKFNQEENVKAILDKVIEESNSLSTKNRDFEDFLDNE